MNIPKINTSQLLCILSFGEIVLNNSYNMMWVLLGYGIYKVITS